VLLQRAEGLALDRAERERVLDDDVVGVRALDLAAEVRDGVGEAARSPDEAPLPAQAGSRARVSTARHVPNIATAGFASGISFHPRGHASYYSTRIRRCPPCDGVQTDSAARWGRRRPRKKEGSELSRLIVCVGIVAGLLLADVIS